MAKKQKNVGGAKSGKVDFYKTLIAFALIPMIISIAVTLILTIRVATTEVKKVTKNSLTALSEETGMSYDFNISDNEKVLKSFVTAPIVKEFLKNQGNAELAAKAQAYTLDYFGQLTNWEGIYIASWESEVLTHPAAPVIGKVMREGDRLKELQNAMLAVGKEDVYNTGIITSPASGELIVSMYAPVLDDDGTPLGYVGAGTFVKTVVETYDCTEKLGFSSAYTYMVNPEGIMIYHPDETKIGNPVENEAVKSIVADLAEGKELKSGLIEYKYKGAIKYAAYFVGDNNYYISIITVDEKDVLAEINKITKVGVGVAVLLVVIFAVIALIIAGAIVDPLKKLTNFTNALASGNLAYNIDADSAVKETASIISSANALKSSLSGVIANVYEGMSDLNNNMSQVDNSISGCTEAVRGVTAAVDEIAKNAVNMEESVQTTSTNMAIVGDNITNIQASVNEVKLNADNVDRVSTEAQENLARLVEANKDTVKISEEVVRGIMESNSAVEEINMAADVITNIASQTNLLSLNASIEAARAGEAGRGFAVVAGEIKGLAEQSNHSANEIKDIIANLVQKFSENTVLVEKIKESISNEGQVLGLVNSSFDQVSNSISLTTSGIEDIYEKTSELIEAKDNVMGAVNNLSVITEENASNCEETTAAIEEINSTIEEINEVSKDTVEVAAKLSEKMGYFNI